MPPSPNPALTQSQPTDNFVPTLKKLSGNKPAESGSRAAKSIAAGSAETAELCEEDPTAHQRKIDEARATLNQLEAEEATRLHGALESFNARYDAANADLRAEQDRLDAAHRITAQRQAEETARRRAARKLELEQTAVAKMERLLEITDAWEQATASIAACRQSYIDELAELREVIRELSPNGSTAGCDKMECVNRMTDRMGALLRLSLRGSGSLSFGRLNVATVGMIYEGRATGWRAQEERKFADVVDGAIAASRARG
jgi:hypothetical protein